MGAVYTCSGCHAVVARDASVCPHCHALLSGIRCTSCGFVGPESSFAHDLCPRCGSRVNRVPQQSRTPNTGQRLRDNWWFIALLLFFFFPAGLIMLWLNGWAKRTKVIVTAVVAGALVLAALSPGQTDNHSTPVYHNLTAHMSAYLAGYSSSWAQSRWNNGADSTISTIQWPTGTVIVIDPSTRDVNYAVQSLLPKADQPNATMQAAIVVWVQSNYSACCTYTDGETGYQAVANITFVQPGTGHLLAEQDVTGPPPSDAVPAGGGGVYGGAVAASDIAGAITSQLDS